MAKKKSEKVDLNSIKPFSIEYLQTGEERKVDLDVVLVLDYCKAKIEYERAAEALAEAAGFEAEEREGIKQHFKWRPIFDVWFGIGEGTEPMEFKATISNGILTFNPYPRVFSDDQTRQLNEIGQRYIRGEIKDGEQFVIKL